MNRIFLYFKNVDQSFSMAHEVNFRDNYIVTKEISEKPMFHRNWKIHFLKQKYFGDVVF